MVADDIDEVIEELTAIIDRSKRESSRRGYFPALYRQVTHRVKEGISSGRFEEPSLMERFDVVFANRYLQAEEDRRNDQSPTRSWQSTFEAATHWSPLVLQHILLGMNAHINLDLGIAAVEVTPANEVELLKPDFFEINDVLAEMIDVVQEKLNDLSPWLHFLDRAGDEADEVISNFCLRLARAEAWQFARQLDGAEQPRRSELVHRKDQVTAERAEKIVHPGGLFTRFLLWGARLREPSDPVHVIRELSDWS